MNILILILKILEVLVFVYLGVASVYIFFFSLLGLFNRKRPVIANPKIRKMAVMIPGYKEDAVIIDVAKSALEQDYPADSYDVIIIADSFHPDTVTELKKLPIRVIEVIFDKSTKSKALNAAMAAIGDDYDIAVVLDADNIMAIDFLKKINQAFERGFHAVQGHRTSKNMNTSMALLDSVSEEVNNHIFRKGHRVAGLSSALIGSAMAFRYDLFKNKMAQIKSIAGEDKELELRLMSDRITIEYLDDALVMDEKVQKQAVFESQRKRWLAAQFQNFRDFAWDGVVQFLTRFNVGYLDKVYQMMQPPRILQIGLLVIITAMIGTVALINPDWTRDNLVLGFPGWLIILGMTVLAFLFSVPRRFYNKKTLIAILILPMGFWLMFRLLFRLKGADKTFIHTPHGLTNEGVKENQTPK